VKSVSTFWKQLSTQKPLLAQYLGGQIRVGWCSSGQARQFMGTFLFLGAWRIGVSKSYYVADVRLEETSCNVPPPTAPRGIPPHTSFAEMRVAKRPK
jgi:hypothetical protein